MTLNELDVAIIKWAEDRKITTYSTPYAQAFKTAEEVQELIEAVAENKTYTCPGHGLENEIRDAIGDIYVTLVVGAACYWVRMKDLSRPIVSDADVKPLDALQRSLITLGAFSVQSVATTPYLDTVATMIARLSEVARDFGTTLEICVEQAYNAIKDRKGTLLPNGIFVKEE